MSEWDDWFNKSVQVRRTSEAIVNFEESLTEAVIYAALPTCVMGRPSDTETTILGQLGLANFYFLWRQSDIDDEIGWPVEKDVVVYNGQHYFINKIEDHTSMPGPFSLPPHKLAHVGEDPIEA